MTSHLLAKAAREGREIVNVTPERAGWKHVGFRAIRLRAGETETLHTGAREMCLVVLTGTVDATIAGQTHANLGSRSTVFEPVSPAAVYLPAGQSISVRAQRDAELAVCTAPAGEQGSGERTRIKPSILLMYCVIAMAATGLLNMPIVPS